MMKFKVFGRIILVEQKHGVWQAYYPGNDGKNRPADFIIPKEVKEGELAEYLGDLFHEEARANHNDVYRMA